MSRTQAACLRLLVVVQERNVANKETILCTLY